MSTTASAPLTRRPLPVGWGTRRLQHPILSAGIAAVVGVVATAVGPGIGIRHLTKAGLTTTTVLGFVLLVFGVALLAFAGAVGWRALHRWQRLWLLPVTLVALLAGATRRAA